MESKFCLSIILFCINLALASQHLSEFESITPGEQNQTFKLPSSHHFQYIIEHGDELTEGGALPDNCDFTGYVSIEGSSTKGYLSINSEATPGGVTILDIELDISIKNWIVTRSKAVDFTPVAGTARNCSGAITPWGTIITCEETTSSDLNGDSYYDLGWSTEIDPVTKKIIDQEGGLVGADKLWALGNFKHENAIIHENRRTVYQGVDDGVGYLYKFVADVAENLSSGKLYVYKGSKNGSGEWILLGNSTASEQNSTLSQSANVGATVFAGVEDVDISPIDGKVYLAVKSEDRVYRFDDSDPLTGTTVINFETYVGGQSYEIDGGIEPWGSGNDNLVFDDLGNLWVTQDGGRNYIWVVENGHTQNNPKVKIFAQAPLSSEPTGLTFTPDYKYLFMSIQHPSPSNSVVSQKDAFGNERGFDKDVAIVIALVEDLNNPLSSSESIREGVRVYPNPVDVELRIELGKADKVQEVHFFDPVGKEVNIKFQILDHSLEASTTQFTSGIYTLRMLINNEWISRKIIVSR
ncbi:MAG: alkaline phosphatase PhoX [Cyclobacteriaceae bacterium]